MESVKFQYGAHTVVLETGVVARQADGAIMVSMGDTVVLVTVVGKKAADPSKDFFPLTVNYQEKTYAAGKIPGGYFKREAKPSEKETLVSRLIDRPLRPLFPESFTNEVQVVATVLSVDTEIDSDIPAMIGASAALAISGIPFNGPMGAARVGYIDGQYVLNPTVTQLKSSALDLVVAGTEKAVLMVESEAKILSEEIMLNAVYFGHQAYQDVIAAVKELAAKAGKARWDWQAPAVDTALQTAVINHVEADLKAAYQIRDKQARYEKVQELRQQVVAALVKAGDETSPSEDAVKNQFHELEKHIVRNGILNGDPRIDGRDTRTVRPITIKVGVLPRTHGSVLFTRGETQAIVVTTLGTEADAQTIDGLGVDRKDRFMLHYNFPPFSVGEVGQMTGPKRREIGHGKLARRALEAVLPSADEFNYVLRVVSEITESNGSSSMASVCGGALSLMDAGVPIKAPVAGVAMGLIKDTNRFAVLTDILGDEDHLGDMDFKVAGTEHGVTALQMDIKTDGITKDIMKAALAQALEGRLHILGIMNQAIDKPRIDVSEYAPKIITIKIDQDKIRDVIGKGGVMIRQLTEETGTTIDISDDGTIKIAAVDSKASAECERRIRAITAVAEVGAVYQGKVVKLMDFGAIVEFLSNKSGLVHISQICHERVEQVSDKLSEGQVVTVKVVEIDNTGRVRLSMKGVDQL